MSYTFLGLVNEVNRRFNEVELTSANFASSKGFYSTVKDSVNTAIRDINQTHYEWPFNHASTTLTLVVGQSRYPYPANASSVNYETFRIKENTTFNNDTTKLDSLTYEEYLSRFVDQEYTTDTTQRALPRYIVHPPSQEILVSPAPDNAYELVYEYYTVPDDLSLSTDIPTIPSRFKHVIVEGALYHAYMFRGNEQSASMAKAKFEEAMKKMRIILINRYDYVTSTYTPSYQTVGVAGPRV
jgi:hypothetical protein